MTRRGRALLALVAVVGLGAGCTIEPDGAPRDIAPEDRALLVADESEGAETAGEARIYLVAPGDESSSRQLRAVQRDVVLQPEPLLAVLLAGPNQTELDSRLRTEIPPGTRLLGTRTTGETLFVDISDEILELTGEALTVAVAQIVFTAVEIPGIQTVRLRVDGEDQTWPRGDGQPRSGSLRVFDYPGLVESSQPDYPGIPG
ncbi:MAG: GerMN domain-containing protein [Ilumatobacteraceae bacterium]